MAAPTKEAPRFESFAAEIRNMIYKNLFPPAELRKVRRLRQLVPHWDPQHQDTYVFHTADTAILRTNRNINQEASAVLYRNVLLVSIDWNTSHFAHLRFIKMPQNVTFNYVRPGTLLPQCAVRIRHQYHDKNSSTATTSMIVAAADFPVVCRILIRPNRIPPDYICKARAFYSVISMPKIGCSVDKLRELIWILYRTLREGHLVDLGERAHRNPRPVDYTGVFEKTAALLDRDRELDDEHNTDRKDESDESDGNDRGSNTDANEEEEGEEEDSDEEDSDEEDSDEDSDENGKNEMGNNEDGNNNEKRGRIDNDENGSDEAHDQCSNGPGKQTSHGAASDSDDEDHTNAPLFVKDNSAPGRRSDDQVGQKVPGDNESKGDADGMMDKRGAKEH